MPALDDLQFQEFDPHYFKDVKPITGPSPYADKPTEGPSYIPPELRQKPLVPSGIFANEYGQHGKDISPLLGRDYSENVQVADFIDLLLDAKSSEQDRERAQNLIRDIAIEISRKGAVVFRNQHKLTVQKQKDFTNQLGLLTGKPKENGLHIHPRAPAGGLVGEDGIIDPEVFYVFSSFDRVQDKLALARRGAAFPSAGWHTDITFEPVPADYSALKIVDQPDEGSGGDTVFANGYALYERLSEPLQEFLENLTGTYSQPVIEDFGKDKAFDLYSQPRGAPENVGDILTATHPVVRTNPVTGWKSVFALGTSFTKFNELTPIESKQLRDFLNESVVNSHNLQVRISWNSNHDIIFFDNRSSYHTATRDYLGTRRGIRTISIGERPYLDKNSGVQSEAIYRELDEKNGTFLSKK
ncbi:uncharacterized protein SAPINGB_P005971 [Magnusiomyces paraingens]|uniref:TauD/TfdA-like domain-containing protein n=1 Tax=Magnusiomyces paraingens TaxID=2606893 RepID=A0A5E8C7S6_9ASCO|nr:uncharacterized protein SAPINGB_P005971 [Saprochaete ingens]VVT57968.1 unnamed protein product [Saprochaete ingens]